MSINPETLHGNHYTETDFDTEVESRLEYKKQELGSNWDHDDESSYKRTYVKQVYFEWNPDADYDTFMQFEMMHSLKYFGTTTMGYVKANDTNPLLEPIHGISLDDYAAIAMNLTNYSEDTLFNAFGIDKAIWEEVNILWPKRMQEDATFTIINLYGEAFMNVNSNPKLQALQNNATPKFEANADNLNKLKTDKYFYLELEAARSAAYEYGIDGAQWVQEEFGINLMDFQSVAMDWMTKRNLNFNTEEIHQDSEYQLEKTEEYKKRFAEEQGGNVADDIDF